MMKLIFTWSVAIFLGGFFPLQAVSQNGNGSSQDDRKETIQSKEDSSVKDDTCRRSRNVPVAPNQSVVTGKVLKFTKLNSLLEGKVPEQTLYALVIKVHSSEDSGGEMNYVERHLENNDVRTGDVENAIKVYTNNRLDPSVFGNTIRGKVVYRGDERGGSFWISDVTTIEEGNEH